MRVRSCGLFAALFVAGCSTANETNWDAGPPEQDAAGDTVSDAGPADTSAGGSDGSAGDTGGDTGGDATSADSGSPPVSADAEAGTPTSPPRRTPDEVLVVYNASSPISTAVANDYAQKRNVANLLAVMCADSAVSTDNETIALADYTSSIATPIGQYLASHAQIDFIVLTKGVPIRIDGAPTGSGFNSSPAGQPSVDSFLAAIDYPTLSGATEIGITGSGTVGKGWLNRYWNAAVPFHHAQFGGYLVTRLDGYTQADAQSLVTRALAAEQAPPAGSVLFDVPVAIGLGDKTSPPAAVTGTIPQESSYDTWNADMLRAHDMMEATGIPNELDLATSFVGGRSNLTGYFSWGSNDPAFDATAYESLTFAPGSLSDTAVSTSGRTFLPTSGGQSLLVDLIAHGLTSGKGYVGEPLLQAVASPSIALARYYSGYSMAESLYAASRFVGWEDVVIGDPLCTPYSDRGAVVAPTYASAFDNSSGGVQTEGCSEGGMDVGSITDGSYTVYKAVPLADARTFVARVASAGSGGNIEVHLDGPTGALLGSCSVPVTGDWQTWTTQTCSLSAASGPHDVYLVFTGAGDGGGNIFNLQWFAFRP
jgi:uncharacterized protein (TIGR03790 family)